MTAPPGRTGSLTSRLARTSVTVLGLASAALLLLEWVALSSVIRTGVIEHAEAGPGAAEVRHAVFQLAHQVILAVLGTSAVVLGIITLLAGHLIRRAAGRSLRRVSEVTALARSMTSRNMNDRLRLGGAEDEIKELGDVFDSMLERLQEAFERQDRFIANASHELRTPITVVRTSLETAVQGGHVPASARPAVDRSLRATTRLSDVLDALLQLARARVLSTEFRHPVDVAETARVVLDEFRSTIFMRRLDATSMLEEAWVDGDQVLIMQAVHNLVDNAIRYNECGGVVRVAVGSEQRTCVVRVENTGPVIPEDMAPRLVEAFHRGARTRRTHDASSPGTGLGLSVVDTIARQHDGRLVIAPRAGGGLVVSLGLPLIAVSAGQALIAPDSHPVSR